MGVAFPRHSIHADILAAIGPRSAEIHGDDGCKRCGCCCLSSESCSNCAGEGYISRFEEDPLWYDEDELFRCDWCDGKGHFEICGGRCDDNGEHAPKAAK